MFFIYGKEEKSCVLFDVDIRTFINFCHGSIGWVINIWTGPILWRGSASMGYSKSRVEDEWLGENHTSTSDSLDWHSWKIEKVASGGWELASGG